MTGWNLPPGVSESDIPGNRPEDAEEEFSNVIDRIIDEAAEHGFSAAQVYEVWWAGLSARPEGDPPRCCGEDAARTTTTVAGRTDWRGWECERCGRQFGAEVEVEGEENGAATSQGTTRV